LAAALWALAPLDSPDLTVPDCTTPATATLQTGAKVAVASLDISAFRAPLWVAPSAPPPPAPAAPPPPPRPPFRLQLLAVFRDNGLDRALFYDPDRDRLVSVAEGQTIADAAVVEK